MATKRHRNNYERVRNRLAELFTNVPRVALGQRLTLGLEEEFQFVQSTGLPGQAYPVIEGVSRMEGYEAVYDDIFTDELIAARHPVFGGLGWDAGYSLVEWDSPPVTRVQTADALRNQMLCTVLPLAGRNRLTVAGIGRLPLGKGRSESWKRKGRYETMRSCYGPEINAATMCAARQVSVGTRSMRHQIKVTNTFLALSGAITAMTANSPIHCGRAHKKMLASRQFFWSSFAEASRVGVPNRPFGGLGSLLDWLLGEKLLFYKKDGQYVKCGQLFWRAAARYVNDDEMFTQMALLHIGTCWQEARARILNGTVEFRSMCQQPQSTGAACEALIVGLAENVGEAWDLVLTHTWDQWRESRDRGACLSFGAKVGREPMVRVCNSVLNVAERGLKMRKLREERYLRPFRERVLRRRAPALDQLRSWGKGGRQQLIQDSAYEIEALPSYSSYRDQLEAMASCA